MFGSNHEEIGDLNANLILKTAGKLRVQIGNSFVDLLEKISELEQRIDTLENSNV